MLRLIRQRLFLQELQSHQTLQLIQWLQQFQMNPEVQWFQSNQSNLVDH